MCYYLFFFFQTSFKTRRRKRNVRYARMEMERSLTNVVGAAQLARSARVTALDMSVNIFEG